MIEALIGICCILLTLSIGLLSFVVMSLRSKLEEIRVLLYQIRESML